MTTARESEVLTRVGPGTPMGEMMRQYWIPAALSSELEADGEPMRLTLLGEKLIAFRDTSGRVGVMDHRCPHRCASLFFGRNEEDGIRCVYHGWKFDVEGNCLDMANLPPEQEFKDKVHAKAYKATERNGLIWVFMGAAAEAPPLPNIEATLLAPEEANFFFVQRECNWLQALEGDIDTSHFSFLHAGALQPENMELGHIGRNTIIDRAPAYESGDTEWGTMYGAHREAEGGEGTYWRFAQMMFPFWTTTPNGAFDSHIVARAWVPMDDTHTMFFHASWKNMLGGLTRQRDGAIAPGLARNMQYLPNSTDWHGRWRLATNRANDYQIDRDAQREDIYTGITGIHLQDQAITESMGRVTDHTFEHLAPSDMMITQTRRRFLRAAQAFQKDGTRPPGADDPDVFLGSRGGDFITKDKMSWREAYEHAVNTRLNPTGMLEAAE